MCVYEFDPAEEIIAIVYFGHLEDWPGVYKALFTVLYFPGAAPEE